MTREKWAFLAFILAITEIGLGFVFISMWTLPLELVLTPFVIFAGARGLKSQRKKLAIVSIVTVLAYIVLYFFLA